MATRSTTRNTHGSGSIRQRSDGRWEGRYTVGVNPATGKQDQRSVYGATEAEVAKKLRKIVQEIDDDIFTEPSRLTVGKWLDIWHSEYLGGVKPSTALVYEQHIKNHLKPAFRAVKLPALTTVAIQKLYNDMKRKGLSPKTIKNVHGVLHKALKQATMLGYIRSNPASSCQLPRIEKAAIKPLDAPELKQFLTAISGHEYEALYRTAVFTGLREGEILGLQWKKVDFERGTILIDQQLIRPYRKGDTYKFGALKNDKPRTITPAPSVMAMLKERRKFQIQQRLQAGDMWNEGDFPDLVFTDSLGKHLNYQVVLRELKRIYTSINADSTRFHDLRHTYAVSSLRAGDDIKTVQGNLGHHTAAFTLDQYGHVTDTMKRESSQRMEAFIEGLGTV